MSYSIAVGSDLGRKRKSGLLLALLALGAPTSTSSFSPDCSALRCWASELSGSSLRVGKTIGPTN
eukprot:14577421-Alexandrium_andersonii.AAC.1